MHIWWTKLCVCAPGYLWRAKEWHNVRCLQENLYSAIFKQMTRKTTKEKHTEREREAKNPSEHRKKKKTFMCVHFIFVPKNTDIMNLFLFKTRKMIIALYSVTNWTHFVRCLITVTMEIILNFVTYNDFVSKIFKRTEKTLHALYTFLCSQAPNKNVTNHLEMGRKSWKNENIVYVWGETLHTADDKHKWYAWQPTKNTSQKV